MLLCYAHVRDPGWAVLQLVDMLQLGTLYERIPFWFMHSGWPNYLKEVFLWLPILPVPHPGNAVSLGHAAILCHILQAASSHSKLKKS